MLTIFLLILAAPIMLAAGVFSLEVASSLVSLIWPRSIDDTEPTTRPTIAVLVPAHNESKVITETLRSIHQQLDGNDRLLVVADNCTDDTAAIAAKHHAKVIERHDTRQRGKGFALDYGIQWLCHHPPAIVIIVDADCIVGDGAITRLATTVSTTDAPAQACYLLTHSGDASLRQRIAEFAWKVKNQVRPLGLHRADLGCQLTGSGMAFPWKLISSAPLANANIVEDLKLGIDLALSGHAASLCPTAEVISEFPRSDSAASTQRTRWEHGHLRTILTEVPGMMLAAIKNRDPRILALALDLAVPPLTMLTLLLLTLTLAYAGVACFGPTFPLIAMLASAAVFGLSVMAAWFFWGRHTVSLTDLLALPIYMLAKLPIYLRFWRKRQKDWVRTDRN